MPHNQAMHYQLFDDFATPTLSLDWQWNHNPDNALWSLSARAGYLRLQTGKVVENIFQARNTLSQRTVGPRCSSVISIDITHMKEGDVAGLGAFCAEPGLLSVIIQNNKKFLVMTDRGEEQDRILLNENTLFLRMDCDFTVDNATFFYSLDGTNWTQLGGVFHMIYNLIHFMGNRIALFCYATQQPGGYVDIDFFSNIIIQ